VRLLNTNDKNTESLGFNIFTNIHSLDAYTGFFGIDRYEQLSYLLCRKLPYSCHKNLTIVHCIYFEQRRNRLVMEKNTQ